jgi:hypothetical protein
MIKKTLSLIFLILIFVSISANASDISLYINPALDPDKPADQTTRLNYAKALHKKINDIYDAIPNLSPSQEQWLKSETSTKNPQRLIKATLSDEFYLQNNKLKLKSILTCLTLIIDKKYKNQQQETMGWLVIADSIMDLWLTAGIAEIVDRGLVTILSIPKRSSDDISNWDFISCAFNKEGRSILGAIIGPYLAGTLPK